MTFEEHFSIALDRQAARQNRTLSPINNAVAKLISSTALRAISDTRRGAQSNTFKVVSAPTGSSKTNSATSFAVAMYAYDKDFTCAFVVEEIKHAQEIYEALSLDIPKADLGVWTGFHDTKQHRPSDIESYGFTPELTTLAEVASKRIVIYTHKKWLSEIASARDFGVRHYLGKARDVLFIDEQPSVIQVMEKTPSDILKIRDLVASADTEHELVKVLSDVVTKMESTYLINGNEMEATELVNLLETYGDFTEDSARAFCSKYQVRDTQSVIEAFKFLYACSLGYCFLNRLPPKNFVAYLPTFKPESNQVILDATADISGLYPLLGGRLTENVPKIDYSNLTITHVQPPDDFKNVNNVVKNRTTSVKYADWIKQVVMEKTNAGDRVLVVVHKSMVTAQGLFNHSPKTTDLVTFPERIVNVIWWGQGIGSNIYKDCTEVFMFSEFYQPRRAIVANTLGAKQMRASEADLHKVRGNLTGEYLNVYEGDILRWVKQLASRGNVRNIDSEGTCGVMNLYTSMDYIRLISNLQKLFPRTKPPLRTLEYTLSDTSDSAKRRRVIVDFLSTSSATKISYVDLANQVGIKSGDIGRELTTKIIQPVFAAYNWYTTSAKDLGIAGKGKWLVKKNALA